MYWSNILRTEEQQNKQYLLNKNKKYFKKKKKKIIKCLCLTFLLSFQCEFRRSTFPVSVLLCPLNQLLSLIPSLSSFSNKNKFYVKLFSRVLFKHLICCKKNLFFCCCFFFLMCARRYIPNKNALQVRYCFNKYCQFSECIHSWNLFGFLFFTKSHTGDRTFIWKSWFTIFEKKN